MKLSGLRGGGWRKAKGREKEKNEFPAKGSLAFSWIGSKQKVFWEHAQSCPKGPASGSLKGVQGDGVRGAKREREALLGWPRPMMGDVKFSCPQGAQRLL